MKGISLVSFLGVVFSMILCVFSIYAEELPNELNNDVFRSTGGLLPGEKINYHDGAVDYYLNTLSLEGNGLPIKLGIKFGGSISPTHNFGQFSLDIPQLTGLYVHQAVHYEDGNDSGNYKVDASCSNLVMASDANFSYFGKTPVKNRLDSSVKLNIGDEIIHFFPKNHDLSQRFPTSADLISPSNWYIECSNKKYKSYSPIVDNFFKVISPDGIEYHFDGSDDLVDGAHEYGAGISSKNPSLFVTSIEDKQGNIINYEYSNELARNFIAATRLKTITASDGRKLSFSYNRSNGSHVHHRHLQTITVTSNSTISPIKHIYSNVTYRSASIDFGGGKNKLSIPLRLY